MIWKKLLKLFSLMAVLALIAGACGSDSESVAEQSAVDEADAESGDAGGEGSGGEAAESLEEVTLSLLIDNTEVSVASTEGLTEAFTAKYPNITFDVEQRPTGADGDNVVKTRLATGEMSDVFFYNSGSLLQALNPTETLLDLSGDPAMEAVSEAFIPAVSQDGGVFGVPSATGMGGGILYNKTIYAEQNLSVPTSWAEFEANNEALLAAGIAPVGATFADTWTSQLFVLADFYNVSQEVPSFADDYTANAADYATTPAALRSFERLEQAHEQGWFNDDFASATFNDGLQMLADGEVAHYPMLSFAMPAIAELSPDTVENIGFFAQPGEDAATNGLTLWLPAGAYISADTEHAEEAKLFLRFLASVEGADAMTAAVPPSGPYLIAGASLPDDTLPAIQDIQAYIDAGQVGPALEFLSPIKGPALEQITVEVGSGFRSAADAAALYDQDVEKQAQQLGLPGW